MHTRSVLFDLDGTLTDSGPGIINSVKHALTAMGIVETNEDQLKTFIGPPLAKSFRERYTLTEEETTRAIMYYREYYTGRGIYENSLYPGIEDLLKSLCAAHIPLYIATAKPEIFAVKIAEYFHIAGMFTGIYGSTIDGRLTEKKDIISHLLERCSPVNPIMVGDRVYDITGGRLNGIKTVGVLYGYGSEEEIGNAAPDCICRDVAGLTEYLLGQV